MNLFLQKQKNIAAKTHPPKKDQQKYSLLHMTRTAREWSPIVAVCRGHMLQDWGQGRVG